MPDGTSHSNAVRAGAFLVTAVLAALAVALTLSKSSFLTSMNDYVVEFDMTGRKPIIGIAVCALLAC